MGDLPAQDPYGEQPPQPGRSGAEPYPGYGDVHADYHRRQQDAAAGPPASVNPLRNRDNWGVPPARPGLNPQEQAMYDSAKNLIRGRVLRLLAILGVLLLIGILSLIQRLL